VMDVGSDLSKSSWQLRLPILEVMEEISKWVWSSMLSKAVRRFPNLGCECGPWGKVGP
jgi:hypothetical protein